VSQAVSQRVARNVGHQSASDAITSATLAQRARTYPDRLYRRVSELIDHACDQVERVNEAGDDQCPPAAGAILVHLQRLAGEPTAAPDTSRAAHDELFRLSSVLLGRPLEVEDAAVAGLEADR
jgi:hypothetical protein